ncbi:MAG TPA: GWxTD domain-containing protein [Acidobacteriota bacterium]|nr:GWxTD domain-containing protein [Acidobacteriota bacterium]
MGIKIRRKTLFAILSISFIFTLLLYSKRKPELPSKYKKWIKEEVAYIITPAEKEVFYKLETDKERDLFIKEFWRQRDPTPGTPKNELREEHYRRIKYANENFRRGTSLKGWRTDRGKFYIALGNPVHIEKFRASGIYPIDIWYYQGNPKFGQPPTFRLLFFKKNGMGEFVLYNPLSDGPRSLTPLIYGGTFKDQDKAAYNLIRDRVSIDLAASSLSSFPGEGFSFDSGWKIRIPSTILVSEAHTYPHKKVQDDYAYEFLEHGGIVEVSYSVNYIGNRYRINILQDPAGLYFVNYALEPDNLSVDFYQDKYFANVKTTLRVTDRDEKTIYQRERSIPIELRKDQLANIKERPFHLCGSFPIIPGDYTLHMLWENTVTKEFTSLEENLTVPEVGNLLMSPLIMANKVNRDSPYKEINKAFQVGSLQIYPSLRNIFSNTEPLFVFFQVFALDEELKDRGILEFRFLSGEKVIKTIQKDVDLYDGSQNFLEEFPLDEFSPGRYRINITLLDNEGQEYLQNTEEFSVTQKTLPDPWILSQTDAGAGDTVYSYILGNQFLNKGETEKARHELEKACDKEPDSLDYALSYARVLFISKEFKKAREILLPFINAKKENFTLYYYLGKASQEQGELEEAISYYQKAISHKGNIVEILNSIGYCYFLLGENEKALRSWKKSLEINPRQERIKKVIEVIEEQKK